MRSRVAPLVAGLLAGCSLAPPHERPPLPTPAAYPAEVAPEGGVRSATEIGWRDFFQDERLRVLIEMTLRNNRDLRIAVARIEEARGQYRIQRANRFPTLEGSASAMRSRTTGVSVSGGALSVGPEVSDRYDVSVAAPAFELDFWGRVRSLSEAARSEYLSSIAAERAFRLSLIRDLATSYLSSREIAERTELAERTVESRREGLRIAKLRLDAGVTSALDYRQAETLLTQAETELASLRNQRAQTRNFIQFLVGEPIDEPALPPARLLANQNIVRDISAGLPSALLVNRPDIQSAEESLRAARANVGAARAAFFPTISLTGNAGFASDALHDLFGSDGATWSFGPAISIPIFDMGRRSGNLTVARARDTIAVATYEQTVQIAFREVADALAQRRYLAEQVAAQSRALVAQRALADLARARYLNGVAQYIEVLDAERNLFAAEQAMIQLRSSELQNRVTLYTALGGGQLAQSKVEPGLP